MDTRTSTRNIVGDKRDASPPENTLLGKVDNEPSAVLLHIGIGIGLRKPLSNVAGEDDNG